MLMQPIPTPQVLDPDRVLDNDRGDLTADHEARAALLDDALHKTCDYAQQLWQTLDAIRGYLMDSLPPDPRSPGPAPHVGAAPTGPEDAQGWDNWIAAYASVTSALCGPHGDSGYGRGEARHAAELRRTAPILNLHGAHPELSASGQAAPATPTGAGTARSRSSARTLGTAVLVLLAVRGLLPRRHAGR
jgi:hypothetical protein